MSVNMEFRKSYNFSTLAPAILGNAYKAMKVISVMIAEDAQSLSSDVYTTHQQLKNIIPNLPEIVNCTFYKLEDTLGNIKIFALEYIDINSIVLVNSIDIKIIIKNSDTSMVSVYRDRLKELGTPNFDISIV